MFMFTTKCNRLQKPITVSGYIFVTRFVLFKVIMSFLVICGFLEDISQISEQDMCLIPTTSSF